MAIMHSLTFGGINSLDYGIYITGEGVYNAPVRDVEMIAVPGRNGDIAIDKGRYENISIRYTAGCFGDDQTQFAQKMADFRMALVGQIGYQRLEDTYHPGDYREAIFTEGLEVEPVSYSRAGQFEIVFNCKPQRFVADGQTEVTVAAGGTVINNPTPFDAFPLLEVEGYGTIKVGSQSVKLADTTLGYVQVSNPTSFTGLIHAADFSSEYVNVGDAVNINGVNFNVVFHSMKALESVEVTGITGFTDTAVVSASCTENTASMSLSLGNINWSVPSTAYYTVGTITLSFTATDSDTATIQFGVKLKYDRNILDSDVITAEVTGQTVTGFVAPAQSGEILIYIPAVMATSTASALGHPTYIDCSIGEVYRYIAGLPISLNSVSDLGTDLPKLAPGNTTVSYSGNVTSLKAIPRYWKL